MGGHGLKQLSMYEDRDQPGLFDDAGIDARFAAFDAANPEVWKLFVQFADELRRAGRERYSADAILHRIRWHYAIRQDRPAGDFKINDHFSSRYARKLMQTDGAFAEFFELRRLRSAG